MADNGEPLLKPLYYEGCPGCELDQWKEKNIGIPYRLFIHVWFVTLCAESDEISFDMDD